MKKVRKNNQEVGLTQRQKIQKVGLRKMQKHLRLMIVSLLPCGN